MFYLVRKSVLGGHDEYQDLDFDVEVLTLGSKDSCTVVLDELFDAEVSIKSLKKTEAKYECNDEAVIVHLGKETKSGILYEGEIYELGVYDIEVIKTPAGFDFALNIIRSKRKSIGQKKRFQIQESHSKFSLRSVSYFVFLLIVLLFLIIPYIGSKHEELSKTLNKLPIPSNLSWSSGPMAMAHRIPEIGNNCQVCHVKPFEKVQDKQCLDCHHNLGEHVPVHHSATDEFSQFLCQNCHKEHNEPTQLTRTDDALCIDCHKEIDKYTHTESPKNNSLQSDQIVQSDQVVQSVTGFNKNDHPNFRLTLINPVLTNGNIEWVNSRPSFDLNNTTIEQSNLKFSHQIHLDKEMVQDESNGKSLSCDNCHQLESDKEHFKPITMDKDCRSCHALTFDVFNPDIELPHGNLRAATVMLQAHFIREFTDPVLREKRAAKKIRRIPGKHSNEASCEGTGLDCGRTEAFKEAEFQFTKNGCITCHEVTVYENSDILSRWFVKPIKINNDWYTKATFDHMSHLSIKGQNKQQVCLSCHDVMKSENSTDIAMPQKEKCLECHEQGKSMSVGLSCIRCHEFHVIESEPQSSDINDNIKP